ncbi:MAG: hypothetical protein VX151_04895 [Candidatus Thermoplasmatota archaeon]|nr:hypothetical protein [Candidatus Thermoplasmatota archaeon]
MSEEELDAAGALAVDEDQDELMEEMSIEERKERLKKTRWNVFLYLGIAAILFFFALFPMPFSADWDDFSTSAEKDIGLVWGLPVDGEDLFDVPMRLTVTADNPPTQAAINIAVYVIEQDDCTDFTLSEKMQEAKGGDSHAYQYQEADSRVLAGGTYDFEFNIDPGQYCLIAEYIDGNGDKITSSGSALNVEGKLYPNQFFGGILGVLCLSLSGFAFFGAQKHGAALRKILEGENETTESKVLSEASKTRIAAGPGGGPPAGPTGPPGAPPAGQTGPAGPPGAPPAEAAPAEAPEVEPDAAPPADEGTYEPAENGYFFRKLPDGSYDQTVYVQNAEGAYVPHEG